ncbi:Na+/H+ antiporter NhaC family protein [bacterium]|nr:Na+/H+ antiporter NhaC family protein [bacterium]MBU1983203.1 Na+/H+ antiporter NhaC family protein [bacterium]
MKFLWFKIITLFVFLPGASAFAQATGESVTAGWISILPPVVAIGLALLLRQVLISLLCGVWLGAALMEGNALTGLLRTVDTYVVGALADADHVAVVLFSLLLGGMVGIISRSGGTAGLVLRLTNWCRTTRSTQLAGWTMGLVMFFDDYANSLVVGPSMRPLTDRLRISREKLAYIVDSTAAPVASLAVISTWIGFEIGLISDAFRAIGVEANAYWVFVQTLPYRFYAIIALALVAMVAIMRRDVGAMWKAETRARSTGLLLREGATPLADFDRLERDRPEGTPAPAHFAWIPVVAFILVALIGLWYDGSKSLGTSAPLYQIIGAASPFRTLLWASMAAVVTAALFPLITRRLSVQGVMDAFLSGVQSMNIAVIILILAWSLGQVCKDMGTAVFVVRAIEPVLSPHLLPAVVFVTAAVISFATGTSWGTMAILMPIAVPAAHQMIGGDVTGGHFTPHVAHLGTIAAVLTGSIFGDHCSPISDTTILSSMCSACDHVDHVRTQMPYALAGGIIATLTGYLPGGWGVSPWICMAAGLAVTWAWLRIVGRRVDT